MSPLQSSKLVLMDATSLGKDALHIYVGLGLMLAVAILSRRSLGSWLPLLAVAVAALAGEVWDLIDKSNAGMPPMWKGSWKDIWNTMFWPTMLFGLARFTSVLKR